jgi:spermidine/putrescine transport system substrate-binding protein
MTQYGREDQELNLLMEAPAPRPGRRRFLQAAGLLAAAGVAGYAGGTLAGRGHDGAAPAAGPPLPGNRRNERLLNIYNWSDYIDDQTIPLFQAQANIRVNYDVYSSNEDLLAKLRAGSTDYDIIVPTSDFIPTYRSLGLIEPLRQDLIPNMTRLDREFVETDYDPGNRYTVPWQWGTTGVGYNRTKVPGGMVDPWAAVFDPASGVTGHVTLLREVTDLIGCALIYLGRSPNSTGDADLAEVVKLLRAAKGRVRKFTSDTYIDELAADETWLAQGWSGDVFQAQENNADVEYVIPQGGLAAVRGRDGHPQGCPPSRQRGPLHQLHPASQGAGPDLQVRQLRHPGVAGQAAAPRRAGERPGDLSAGLDQAVDRHPHRREAAEVAGGLRRRRQGVTARTTSVPDMPIRR